MKKQHGKEVILLILFIQGFLQMNLNGQDPIDGRKIISFDFEWKFIKADPANAESIDFNDEGWRKIQLPHDWSIESNFNRNLQDGRKNAFLPGGVGWYRKYFRIPPSEKGKKILLQFDGVYMNSEVYINGNHVGTRPYGYVSFEYDISPYINFERQNVVAVRVDHSDCPTSRWYSGSGIYRHVSLSFTDPLHVATWGTFITTPEINGDKAKLRVRTNVKNDYPEMMPCDLESLVFYRDSIVVGRAFGSKNIKAGKVTEYNQVIQIEAPVLWDLENPEMYTLKSILISGDKIADVYESSFGIREIEYDTEKGFFLNGRNLKMKGMNLHQDAGSLGTAVPEGVWEYRLKILKEFGVNAIRCSHNPPSSDFLDLCDRIGFLVIDEAFDKWKSGYYEEYFDDWWQKDLEAMLLRDRNHPSVIMWSVGNEVREQETGEGVEILKELIEYTKEMDPSRPVTCALRPSHGERNCAKDFAELMDVVSYNYAEPYYKMDRKKYPDRIILGSECYPYFRGRIGNHRDYNPVNPWYDVTGNDFVIGQFLWSGMDYLGESTAWPSKGWPTGLVDVCGYLKPRSYFHKSVWSSRPMVGITVPDPSLDIDPGKDHWQWPNLAAHWNFEKYSGRVIRVETVTNCRSVELILNGLSFGEKRSAEYPNSTIVWYIPYEKGLLKAIGRNGKEIAVSDELQTSGKAAKIKLIPSKDIIKADGQDVSVVRVQLVDENGIPVPDEDLRISYEVTGNGEIIGLDNGDLRSNDPFKSPNRKTYFGKSLVVIRSGRKEGNIMLKAKGEGLPVSELNITTTINNK